MKNYFLYPVIILTFINYSLANECLSVDNIKIAMDKYQSNSEENLSKVIFSSKKSGKILYSDTLLGNKNISNDIKFIDLDFDGKPEIVMHSDNDPRHSVNYTAVKILCDSVIPHPLFSEFKNYDISIKNKKMSIYFENTGKLKKNTYCYNDIFYLCEESLYLTKERELIKKYNKQSIISIELYQNNNKLNTVIVSKSLLYTAPNKKTKMYLIKGDMVTLLDEQTDDEGQKWYFINYKGKKDLNMWIKAEAIDAEVSHTIAD